MVHIDYARNSANLLMRMGIRHRRLQLLSPPSSEESDGEFDDHDMTVPDVDSPPLAINDHCEEAVEPPLKPQKTGMNNSDPEMLESHFLGDKTETETEEDNILAKLSAVAVKLREWKTCDICPECGKKVENRNLARHIKEFHEKIKFTCQLCRKDFTRKEYLRKLKCPM